MDYTREAPLELDMRVLRADLRSDLHDVRGMGARLPAVYHPSDSSAAQALGRTLRMQRSWGIAYDSVRREGGECVAVLRPGVLSNCRQAEHLSYVWDGARISAVYRKTLLK